MVIWSPLYVCAMHATQALRLGNEVNKLAGLWHACVHFHMGTCVKSIALERREPLLHGPSRQALTSAVGKAKLLCLVIMQPQDSGDTEGDLLVAQQFFA